MPFDFRSARKMQDENRERYRMLKRMGVLTPEVEAEYQAIDAAIESDIASAHDPWKRKMTASPGRLSDHAV